MNNTIKNPICFANAVDHKYLWGGNVPSLMQPLPYLAAQMTVALFVNYAISFALQSFRQPRIISDILTTIVLSPSLLDIENDKEIGHLLVPEESLTILETVSNLGLLYAIFIQGLHADLTPIAHRQLKTTILASISFILPFLLGCILHHTFQNIDLMENQIHNVEVATLYWGLIISATSFPTLAPILSKLRIFCTNVGQEALSLALFNDVLTWVLIQFTIAISSTSPTKYHHITSPRTWIVVIFNLSYMLFCGGLIKPILVKLTDKITEGDENYSKDMIVRVVLFSALLCGFIGEYFGSHFIFTAFVFGTSVPSGVISESAIEKMEECVLGVLMPLYFVVMGIKLDVHKMISCLTYLPIITIGVVAKSFFTFLSAFACGFSVDDGFALGVLLSAKGLFPVVILKIGRDRGHLTEDAYDVLLLILIISTILVEPMTRIRNTKKKKSSYDQRPLQETTPNDELRIVTCLNTPQNVYNMINLLEISNVTSQPMKSIYSLHLVELRGHASPILVQHEARDLNSEDSKSFFRRTRGQSFPIIQAFHDYEDKKNAFGLVNMFTMVSPIEIIHHDICDFAEDKKASLIILSFHRQQGFDCNLEDSNIEFQVVNQKVMSEASCSVGVFIDRGLRVNISTSLSVHNRIDSNNNREKKTRVTMIYIGGSDDREALTYASRMVTHPSVSLKLLRFIIWEDECDDKNDLIALWKEIEKEKKIDDAFLDSFRQSNPPSDSVYYIEMLATTWDDITSILRENHEDCDLYVIGKLESKINQTIEGLEFWSEYRELGPLGDLLVTCDFATNSSMLVIQQYQNQILA